MVAYYSNIQFDFVYKTNIFLILYCLFANYVALKYIVVKLFVVAH